MRNPLMRKKLVQILIVTVVLTFIATACFENKRLQPPVQPQTPNGLQAVAGDGKVTLSWNANGEVDLTGYNVHWGESSNHLPHSRFIAAPDTFYTVTNLANDATYFFAVDAENQQGTTSRHSTPVSATPKNSGTNEPETATIAAYIQSMNDPDPLPTPNSDDVPDQTHPPTTEMQDGAELVCTRKDYSLWTNFHEFVALNPNASVLWPGSLVQGASLPNGIPAAIPLARAPITITATTGGRTMGSRTIENPSLATIGQAMNEILDGYTGSTAAKLSYSHHVGRSFEQGMLRLGVAAEWATGEVESSLRIDASSERNTLYVKYAQEYYTVSTNGLRPDTAFGAGVGLEDVKPYASNTNLPSYISSVTYGRMLLMKMSSTESHLDMALAVDAAVNSSTNVNIDLEAEYERILSNSTFSIVVLGGSAQDGVEVVTSRGDLLTDYLRQGANFSRDSIGWPISYRIDYLRDNTPARVGFGTEYTVRECNPVFQQIEVVLNELRAIETKGCDPFPKTRGEFFYTFDLTKPSGERETLIERNDKDWIRLGSGDSVALNRTERFIAQRKSGERFTIHGEVWEYDEIPSNDLVGARSTTFHYPDGFESQQKTMLFNDDPDCSVELRYQIRALN
jgi:thiol-activated cytolysin